MLSYLRVNPFCQAQLRRLCDRPKTIRILYWPFDKYESTLGYDELVIYMRSKLTMLQRIRRNHLLIIGWLSLSVLAWGQQISLVHVTSCGPQTFPATCTIPSTGSGNVLVAAWTSASGGGGATIATVTDNQGNIYAEASGARATDASANTMADIWYAENSVAGATSVTITPSPSGTSGTAVIWEFSGVEPFSALDQTTVLNSQAATTTPLGAAVVTNSPAEVIVSVANVSGTVTGMKSGNAFTSDSTVGGDGWAHFIATSSGAYTPQWKMSTSGTFCSSTVSFKAASSGGGACDLNQDGAVNVVDVQLAVNIDIGLISCPADVNGGVCGSNLVQQIVTAALGGGCTATVSHSVSLTWTASTSPSIAGYNIYRSTTNGGPYTQLNSSLVNTTSYTDTNVTAGQTYYYVTTAIDTSNNQSAYSNQAQATVPTTI